MDKKEAIQVLQTALTAPFVYGAYAEAIGMAIESLSVESSDDLISRTAAIKAVANAIWHYPNECYKNLNDFDMAEALAKDAIKPLPSAGIPTKCIAQINIDTDEIVKRIKDECEIVDKSNKTRKINCTDFVNWLLEKVLDEEDWDMNYKAYGEIICRKLKKLGVLTVKDGYYIIVE